MLAGMEIVDKMPTIRGRSSMAERQPSNPAIPPKKPNKRHNSEWCAPIGAPKLPGCDVQNQIDPELQTIVGAWSKLPQAIKTGILALVNAAK